MVLRIAKYLLLVLLVVSIAWSGFNYKLLAYGWAQLNGQWNIVYHARPITKVMNDPLVSDTIKDKLLLIEKISTFAQDSLGLKRSENYTTFFDQKNRPLLWVITASERFSIRAYQWHFPVLGKVTYKGFFEYKKGVAEDSLLRANGYDTDYGEVSAWSTLGWFKDPILSSMLQRSEGQLAELIIHEMTHATVYMKSDVDFNENLASMIGEEGAFRFLRCQYGVDSPQLNDYLDRKEDYDRFTRHMLLAKDALDSLYSSFVAASEPFKEERKKLLIQKIIVAMDTIQFKHPNRYKGLFDRRIPNNAYFLNYVRYDSQKPKMKHDLFQLYGGNILRYLQSFQ